MGSVTRRRLLGVSVPAAWAYFSAGEGFRVRRGAAAHPRRAPRGRGLYRGTPEDFKGTSQILPIEGDRLTAATNMVLRWMRAKTERSPRAAFVGFIGNPFEIHVLVDVDTRAVHEPSAALQARHCGPKRVRAATEHDALRR